MTVPLRAALYLRVSTARQAEHDVSIPDQKRQGEAYCQSRGYQVAETYVEPGASATNDRRPEFQRMIEAGTSKPAPFDVVIVHSFKRLYDAIENGVVDLDDPALKDRIAGLKSIPIRPMPTPTAPRRWRKVRDSRLSRPAWSKSSPAPPASASGSTAAVTAATTSAPLPSVSRSRTAKSASWDRKATCSEPSPPRRA